MNPIVILHGLPCYKLERSSDNAAIQEKEIEKREEEIIEIVTDGFLIFLTRSIYSDGYVLKSGSWSLSSLASDATLEISTIGNDLEQCTLEDFILFCN